MASAASELISSLRIIAQGFWNRKLSGAASAARVMRLLDE